MSETHSKGANNMRKCCPKCKKVYHAYTCYDCARNKIKNSLIGSEQENLYNNMKPEIVEIKGALKPFKIGDQTIWYIPQGWCCGSHEVDTATFDTLQKAVDHAVWVLTHPKEWAEMCK